MKIRPKYGTARLRISSIWGGRRLGLRLKAEAWERDLARRLAKVNSWAEALASAAILGYSTRHDQSAYRQISDRADRAPPDIFVPGRDLRHRSGVQQYRGMVAVDS